MYRPGAGPEFESLNSLRYELNNMTWKPKEKKSNPLIGFWYKQYFGDNKYELALEPAIASLGLPYRYQHLDLSRKIIMDYAMPTIKLDIEVDGDSHKRASQIREDIDRAVQLKKIGWTVYRIQNEDAITDPFGCIERMVAELGLQIKGR